MIKNFKLFEERDREQESFDRRIGYIIDFFNSPYMVRWEPDPKKRLEKWIKQYEENPNSVPIESDDAEELKRRLGID